MICAGPVPRCLVTRVEDEPAEDPGIPDGLALRPDDPAFHSRPVAEDQVHLLAAHARFQVERSIGVGVEPSAARLAIQDHPGADGLEHVCVVTTQHEEVSRLGLSSEPE